MESRQAALDDARAKIAEMVRRIVEGFDPERIILFGSHAKGTAEPDSDADLLVVVECEGLRRDLAGRIDVALFGVDMPADVIVARPKDIEISRLEPWSVIHDAVRDGEILYERDGG